MKVILDLSKRDRLIIAYALSLCPVAELGDCVGGSDSRTAERLIDLAAMFDADIAVEMAMLAHRRVSK